MRYEYAHVTGPANAKEFLDQVNLAINSGFEIYNSVMAVGIDGTIYVGYFLRRERKNVAGDEA